MKRLQGVLVVVAAFAFVGCGDRTQTIGDSTSKKLDGDAWHVTNNDASVAPGWTMGDRASWENHLRRRTQMQNDYAPR